MNESVNQTVSASGAWPTKQLAAPLVPGAVAFLVFLRVSVRGVDIMGASVRVN